MRLAAGLSGVSDLFPWDSAQERLCAASYSFFLFLMNPSTSLRAMILSDCSSPRFKTRLFSMFPLPVKCSLIVARSISFIWRIAPSLLFCSLQSRSLHRNIGAFEFLTLFLSLQELFIRDLCESTPCLITGFRSSHISHSDFPNL